MKQQLINRIADKLNSGKNNRLIKKERIKINAIYRIEWSKHNTWIVRNSKDEIVFFGTLKKCERLAERINSVSF